MDVYQASDGYMVQLDQTLNSYDSLEPIIADISAATGVSERNVLLFLEDGRELRNEVLEEAWERGGQGAQSMPPRQTLYIFNRETLWTDAKQWAVQLQEDVQFPPPLNLSGLIDAARAQQPFHMAQDHLSHLRSLYQSQSRSLQIAYSNLFHHLHPLIREFQTFAARAEQDLENEESLIRGARVDMALLPKVVVHEVFTRKKDRDKDKDVEGSDGKAKTLADYVHPRKMEQVRESCRITHGRSMPSSAKLEADVRGPEDHVTRFNDLARQMDELAGQSEAERKAAEERAATVDEEFSEGLARIAVALEQVEALLQSGSEGAAQDLMELDQAMRDDLVALTGVKNDFTLEVHVHLRQIAIFQSQITEMVQPLTTLDSDLRTKAAFPHLHRLHQLPFAYAAAVVEVVRRREFGSFLLEWTSRLAETLGKYTSTERKRRQQLKTETLGHLPWTVSALEDSMAPNIDISVTSGAEALDSMDLGRDDIEALLKWVESLKEDPEVLAAVEEIDANPIDGLQTNLEGIVARMDVSSVELDKCIERSVLITSRSRQKASADSQTLQSLSGQLRAAEQSKPDHAKKVAELEAEHEKRVSRLEEQHQQRTSALQNRQGESQEELVRLRTDLGEEMLTRQALSTQLEERSREHEDWQREHEDQTDLVLALQAELAQQKERATDLGVRLQEALLDVDGLNNAEQSLIGQLQALQDERSKSMKSLSEAQLHSRGLESQVAGINAEMEAMSQQLSTARSERDSAMKNQSTEAERMMRNYIAEADGDRAVLEHQNFTLKKQVDGVRVELEEKLSAAKNSAIRQADGLKAELSFTKAQLRDVQRRETILADDLAMAKDAATAMTHETRYQSDSTRDAVALASRYYECCQRLMTAINTSATISGTASTLVARPRTPPSAVISVSSKDEMRESGFIRSLATASGFDLVAFADAVQKTINLVKKWSKSCKQYRDLARNKISFTTFTKGDLALFLPTRNAAARSWAAFNVSAPHNFLKVTDAMQEQTKTREWIIARIVKTEEAIASGGESPEINPFGLADGLRYFVHHVEEYNPTSVRPVRRSGSTSYNGQATLETSANHMLVSAQTPSNLDAVDVTTSPITGARVRSSTSYFPAVSTLTSHVPSQEVSQPPIETEHAQSNSVSPGPEQVESPSPPQPEQRPASPPPDPTKLSPPITLFAAPPHPRASHQRVNSRPSPPPFGGFSLGRPTSIASSASSHTRGPPGSSPASKTSPAMALTTSGDGSDSKYLPELQRRVPRKASSHSLSPAHDDLFRPSPLSEVSPPIEAANDSGVIKAKGAASGFAAIGSGPAGRLIRGFSITKKRTTSGAGVGPDGKPTALDMLRRFDGGGAS